MAFDAKSDPITWPSKRNDSCIPWYWKTTWDYMCILSWRMICHLRLIAAFFFPHYTHRTLHELNTLEDRHTDTHVILFFHRYHPATLISLFATCYSYHNTLRYSYSHNPNSPSLQLSLSLTSPDYLALYYSGTKPMPSQVNPKLQYNTWEKGVNKTGKEHNPKRKPDSQDDRGYRKE